ncbi:MAG: hypothetical protein L0196_05960 [candidate division Zixibacteria bacterium]|nr:hypothetical protein [candidate division Zixibacteria bacterium]
MSEDVSTFRLYLLRATYLLIAVGLTFMVWPGVIHHTKAWPLMQSVVSCLLAGVSVLAALGIRYPLKMLPLLLFELVWKSIWLIAFAPPLWRAHQIDPETWETVKACLWGIVIMPIVIPWPYVWANYVRKAGDSWK